MRRQLGERDAPGERQSSTSTATQNAVATLGRSCDIDAPQPRRRSLQQAAGLEAPGWVTGTASELF